VAAARVRRDYRRRASGCGNVPEGKVVTVKKEEKEKKR